MVFLSVDKIFAFALPCFLVIFGFPGQSVGISALTDLILQSTELSRSHFSAIYMAATITGCFLVLASGGLVDRFGVRKITLSSLAIWTLVSATLSVDEFLYAKLFAGFLSRTVFFTAFLYVCLSTMRFLGQSMFPMLGRMQIVKNFSKKQSIAMALNGMFCTLSSGVAPRIMRFLAKSGSWQSAYMALSITSLAAFTAYFFLFRDCADRALETDEKLPKIPVTGLRRKLIKMPKFWCITLTLCINAFIGSGSMVHIVDIFRENGIGKDFAINSTFYACCVSIISGFIFGRRLDRSGIRFCLLMLLFVQFFALVGLETSKNAAGFWTYIVCIGSSWGGYGIMKTVSWSKMFGGKSLGAILGVVYFASAIVGAAGVFLMSLSREHFGSYFPLMRLIECVIALTAIFVVKKFPKAT
jgi:predicted MFS family arabinose efflux permease